MNAGPGVERLISDWLIEESPAHAPDRILEEAARTIDRTKQRRVGAAWREPMIIRTSRLVVAAVFIIVAILGAGWIGRSTAGVGQPGPTASPTAAPTASPQAASSTAGVSLVTYRAARDAICAEGNRAKGPLRARFDLIFDPKATAAQRANRTDAIEEFATLSNSVSDQLAALDVPANLATAHIEDVTQFRDQAALLRSEVALLRAGKVDQAQAVDAVTSSIAVGIAKYERDNNLVPCP